jgi:hypothetical protein
MAFNSRHVELSKASSVVHILWKFFLSISNEALESSTWRELKAIKLTLCSFQHVFGGTSQRHNLKKTTCHLLAFQEY